MAKYRFFVFILLITFILSAVPFADTLQLGSKGAEVEKLQSELKKLGFYHGPINGVFDEETKTAVKRFQVSRGFIATGVIDGTINQVVTAFSSEEGQSATWVEKEGAFDEKIKNAQTVLRKAGIYKGRIDGQDTFLFNSSLRYFQRKNGLEPTGKLNEATEDKLKDIDKNIRERAAAVSSNTSRSPFNVTAGLRENIPKPTPFTGIPHRPLGSTNLADDTDDKFDDADRNAQGGQSDFNAYLNNEDRSYGQLMDWWTGADAVFHIGATAKVTDVWTGKSFYIVRTYGRNHADCETLTKEDTKIMKELWGGQWSWKRRPAIIEIDGRKIAASIAGMPHAGLDDQPANKYVSNRSEGFGTGYNLDKIKGNDMNGVIDVHFLNSKTHMTNRISETHQRAVWEAAGMRMDE